MKKPCLYLLRGPLLRPAREPEPILPPFLLPPLLLTSTLGPATSTLPPPLGLRFLRRVPA